LGIFCELKGGGGGEVDPAVVNVTEHKEVDSKPYKTLLVQEAQGLFSQINSADALPSYFFSTHFTYHPPITPVLNVVLSSRFPNTSRNINQFRSVLKKFPSYKFILLVGGGIFYL
jgi:hypothetical protein